MLPGDGSYGRRGSDRVVPKDGPEHHMRIVLAIVGALLGLRLSDTSDELFGAFTGIVLGWACGEIIALRRRISTVEREAEELRRQVPVRDSAARTENTAPYFDRTPADAPRPERAQPTADAAGTEAMARTAASAPSQSAPAPRPARPVSMEAISPGYEPPRASAGAPSTAADSASEPRHEWVPPQENAVIRAIREYFTGGNTLVRVGIVILIFGMAFLLRYVAERTRVPIELRLSGVALAAIVLLVLGWKLRVKRPGYALALQGGAVGILYLLVFVSLRLFSVLPASAAFVLLVFLVIFSAALAVLQSSIELAVLGIVGGFLAPVLASTGQGSHVVLFSYYAVLNAGIVGIAWFKAWRPLNLLGFAFTFVIGTAWGVLSYRSEYFASTEPFLVLFFLFYVALAILFASRQPPQLKGYVDGTIVFGTPLVAFGLQSALLRDRPYALAFSALAVSALYLLLAWNLYRLRRETYRLLVEAFMALGVVFLTLAIPLALDGHWSAATWAIEGAALIWVGCRQHRILPRVSGALLQIAAGVIFWHGAEQPALPILNSVFFGALMIAGAAVYAARRLQRSRDLLAAYEQPVPSVLFLWGLAWWLIAGFMEISRLTDSYAFVVSLVFLALTAVLCSLSERRLELPVARWPALALLPVMFAFTLIAAVNVEHPFQSYGWLAWPIAFAAFYWILRRYDPEPDSAAARALHAGCAWLLVGVVSWESAWAINHVVQGGGSWPAIGWALLPALALLALLKLSDRVQWPLAAHRETYLMFAGGGIASYLVGWVVYTNSTLTGDPYPLPYIPFLNPLDITEGFALLVLAAFGLHLWRARYASLPANVHMQFSAVLAFIAFVWLNGVLVRTLHHWADIPFDLEAMLSSTLAQTAVSIFWTVIALTTMLIATRRGNRIVWIGGAALLAVVVAKLFLVDLSRVGTVERIISFVGVGVLMLVIGYFSPLPPAVKEAK